MECRYPSSRIVTVIPHQIWQSNEVLCYHGVLSITFEAFLDEVSFTYLWAKLEMYQLTGPGSIHETLKDCTNSDNACKCKRRQRELRQCKAKAFGIPSWRSCYVESVTLERCYSIWKARKA
ncbi:hypothetical protein Tco_0092321 [Tanacetum coccineum]